MYGKFALNDVVFASSITSLHVEEKLDAINITSNLQNVNKHKTQYLTIVRY